MVLLSGSANFTAELLSSLNSNILENNLEFLKSDFRFVFWSLKLKKKSQFPMEISNSKNGSAGWFRFNFTQVKKPVTFLKSMWYLSCSRIGGFDFMNWFSQEITRPRNHLTLMFISMKTSTRVSSLVRAQSTFTSIYCRESH